MLLGHQGGWDFHGGCPASQPYTFVYLGKVRYISDLESNAAHSYLVDYSGVRGEAWRGERGCPKKNTTDPCAVLYVYVPR